MFTATVPDADGTLLSKDFNDLLDPNNNTVTINKGSVVTGTIEGGRSKNSNVEVKGNRVHINGGEVGGTISGDTSVLGTATNNSVTVSGGKMDSAVFGGYGGSDATGNSVIINGGTMGGFVCGGMCFSNAMGNSVTINGGTVLVHQRQPPCRWNPQQFWHVRYAAECPHGL